ncbi:MAG: MEKHLA domain-containing protein [Akkermansiaceae bacterium]
MSQHPEPSNRNQFLAAHVALLLDSYQQLTGRHLIEPGIDELDAAKAAYEAPFFIASHGLEDDPVLNYGNRYALDLFSMTWDVFTSTPSRYTAEEPNRDERDRLLKNVSENGYIDDYSGVRISADGKRFRIHQATVWNVYDQKGIQVGQAATFDKWDNQS